MLKRTTPLKRSKPLRARKRMVRRKPRRLSRPGADPAYVAWIHLPERVCAGWDVFPDHFCGSDPIEQAHLRAMTGVGRKEPDRQSIPLCRSLHQEFDQHRGRFTGWSKEERREWFLARIAETHAAYRLETGQQTTGGIADPHQPKET